MVCEEKNWKIPAILPLGKQISLGIDEIFLMKLRQFLTLASRSTMSIKQCDMMLEVVDDHNVEIERH